MIPLFPEFKKLELSDKDEIESFTRQFPPYSDFNFVSMWSWDIKSETSVSQCEGNLIVRFTDYLSKEPFYSFIGVNNIYKTIDSVTEYSLKNGSGSKLKFIPNEVVSMISDSNYLVIPDPDNFDYVYNMQEFHAGLGKKYETQRNQINRFLKKHPGVKTEVFFDFSEIKEKILRLEQKWKLNKIIDEKVIEFQSESAALWRIFDLQGESFVTVGLFDGDELIGFCVSELLDKEYAIAHFAKADVNYSGVYSYLLYSTCDALIKKGKIYLNYEQDLGLMHLRNSKTSFRPAYYLKKNIVVKQ